MIKIPHFSTLSPRIKTAVNLADYSNRLCPSKELIFRAFYRCPLEDIKVIIINNEPYNIPGKANGLAFGQSSRFTGTNRILNTIFKEVAASTGACARDFTLESWASQGVLLLNLRLTSIEQAQNAHKDIGWEQLVTDFLKELDKMCRYKVYMLWGKEAHNLIPELDQKNNLILTASHPAPFSANRSTDEIGSFIGCDHFAEANEYLNRRNKGEIKW